MMLYFYFTLLFYSLTIFFILEKNKKVHYAFVIFLGIAQIFLLSYSILRIRLPISTNVLVFVLSNFFIVSLVIGPILLFLLKAETLISWVTWIKKFRKCTFESPLIIIHKFLCYKKWYMDWCIFLREKVIPNVVFNNGSSIFTIYYHGLPHYLGLFVFFFEFTWFGEIDLSLKFIALFLVIRYIFFLFCSWGILIFQNFQDLGYKFYPKSSVVPFSDLLTRILSIEELTEFFPENESFMAQFNYDLNMSQIIIDSLQENKTIYYRNSKGFFILFLVILAICVFSYILNIFLFPWASIYVFFLSLPFAHRIKSWCFSFIYSPEEIEEMKRVQGVIS